MEEEGEEKEEEEEEEESLYLEEQGDGAVDEAGRRPRALDGVRLSRRRDAVGHDDVLRLPPGHHRAHQRRRRALEEVRRFPGSPPRCTGV